MLVLVGLGCGSSPAFIGYFELATWGTIALALIAIAIGMFLARPAVPTGIGAVAVVGLLLFAGWSLLSMGWAESADRALTEGDRWILYAVFLFLAVLLIADRRDGEIFMASSAAAIVCIAGYEVVRMLTGDGSSLFSGSRLNEPLGYVNGLGGYFLLGFWPLIAFAERARTHALAGMAAGAASLLAALVLLTESRGTAFAFGASAVVLLALLPGRSRRAWLLLAVLIGLGAAWGPLTDVTRPLLPGEFGPGEETIRRGAEWSLLLAVLVGIVWGVGRWVVDSLTDRAHALARHLPRISVGLLSGVAFAAVIAVVIAIGNPLSGVSDEYDSFTQLKPVDSGARSTGARFTSGGGNRYDYWRIAWRQFTDHPLEGVGAGNFDRTYFLERRTTEDVRQAHSIELQTLGETGIVGAIALGSFLLAVFAGIWRRARAARDLDSETGLTVAATGIFIVWLAQTSVDWLHLIPGITGLALGAGAVLLLRPEPAREGEAGLRSVPPLGTAAALALAVVAIVLIGRPTLAEHFRAEAQDELQSNPRAALRAVNDSLSLNSDSVQGHYIKAAALARLDAYLPAKDALEEAISREPHNYVSWALLGDLTTRRGEISEAMRAYGRASSLNPRDRALRLLRTRRGLVEQLHRHPESAASVLESLSSQ